MSERGTATLRIKNQMTIPRTVIKVLDIQIGDLILFNPTENGVILKKVKVVPMGETPA